MLRIKYIFTSDYLQIVPRDAFMFRRDEHDFHVRIHHRRNCCRTGRTSPDLRLSQRNTVANIAT